MIQNFIIPKLFIKFQQKNRGGMLKLVFNQLTVTLEGIFLTYIMDPDHHQNEMGPSLVSFPFFHFFVFLSFYTYAPNLFSTVQILMKIV